jgi:folate-binding protein YgfZ
MSNWNQFLGQYNAVINDYDVRFDSAQVEASVVNDSNIISPLLHLGVIKVSGDDAQDFMQNQFTNDLNHSSPQQGQYNAYCSPKGRMLASFWLINNGDEYYLIVARELMEATLKRLRMYVLMSKVVLEDVSETMPVLGVAGPQIEEQFSQWQLPMPLDDLQHLYSDDVHCMKLPGPVPHMILLCAETKAEELFGSAEACQRVGNAAWRLLDIRSGIPMIYQQTVEAFVPQMANLQLINGVSFKKGCYPGQEIVARMQYLGSLKRRMYHARIQTGFLPEVGASLFAAASESGQGAGKVVDAQWADDNVVELLAVAEIKSAEGDKLHLGEPSGPELELLELPYSIEAEAS